MLENHKNNGFVAAARNRQVTHLPVALVIDRSKSTEDIRVCMNRCARDLLAKLQANEDYNRNIELLVVFFNGDIYRGENHDAPPQFKPLTLVTPEDVTMPKSGGYTHTGKALYYALEELDQRKSEWRKKGQDYYQPMLFLMTDGYPSPGVNAPPEKEKEVADMYREAGDRIKSLEKAKKLIFVAAGIQAGRLYEADMDKLRELSDKEHWNQIVKISEDAEKGVHEMEKFFQVIYEATSNAVQQNQTPIGGVLDEILYN